jgi:pimeloyl-ACP methyl ester carboxylesterase
MAVPEINSIQLGNSGHPLVMMHGWGQNLRALQPMAELLADRARIHLLDLPGFGKTPPPPEDWDTIQYADRVLAYLDDRGLDRTDLLGHSFGGRVSMRLAYKYPDRVRSIVLINSGGLQRQRTFQQQLRSQWIKTMRSAFKISPVNRQALLDWHTQTYGSRDYLNAGVLRGTLIKTVREDVTDIVGQIKAPVLLLWGEADTETPVEMAHRYHALFPQSELITVPRRDHFIYQAEGAHLCAYYVQNFLARLSPESSTTAVSSSSV